MIKGVFRQGGIALLALSSSVGSAADRASVNIEEHRESVAPLNARGEPVKALKAVPAAPAVPAPATPANKGKLGRAVFAKQVVKREPVNEVKALSSDVQGVYFFTELEDMAGHTVTHRWEYDGKRVGFTEFKVAAPYWRVWSYRRTPPGSTGTWKVKVLNTVGEVIGEKVLAPKAAP